MDDLFDRRTAIALAATAATVTMVPGCAAQAAPGIDMIDIIALEPAIMRYVWGIDTLDERQALAAFARDARVSDSDGKDWHRANGGAAAFVRQQVCGGMPGGQHHVQINRVAASGNRYRVESYWSRIEWREGAPAPALTAMGTFVDTLSRRGRDWLIAEKRISLWNSATVRVPPVPAPSA